MIATIIVTIVVVLMLLMAMFMAIRSMVKTKKSGGSISCGHNCEGCNGCGYMKKG